MVLILMYWHSLEFSDYHPQVHAIDKDLVGCVAVTISLQSLLLLMYNARVHYLRELYRLLKCGKYLYEISELMRHNLYVELLQLLTVSESTGMFYWIFISTLPN